MEGYHKPEITREDMAEAENVFLTITSDGSLPRPHRSHTGHHGRCP